MGRHFVRMREHTKTELVLSECAWSCYTRPYTQVTKTTVVHDYVAATP